MHQSRQPDDEGCCKLNRKSFHEVNVHDHLLANGVHDLVAQEEDAYRLGSRSCQVDQLEISLTNGGHLSIYHHPCEQWRDGLLEVHSA